MAKTDECLLDCPLSESPEVPYTAGRQNWIMVVGQSPGRTEIAERKPFVGSSGLLLRRVVRKVGLRDSEFMIANSLRCAEPVPPLSGKTLTAALKCCKPKLERMIQAAKPKLIVALGAYATRTLLGKAKITQVRGQFVHSEEYGCDIFPILHPAAILREAKANYPDNDFNTMSNREKEFFQDWKTVAEYVENNFRKVEIETEHYNKATLIDLRGMGYRLGPVAVDVETNTLELASDDARILSISFSDTTDGVSYVVTRDQLTQFPQMRSAVEAILTDEERPKVMANRTFDEEAIYRLLHIRVKGPVYDVLTMAHVNDENYHSFNLESVASIYANMRDIKDLAKGQRSDLTQLSEQDLIKYNGVDTDATIRAYSNLGSQLEGTSMDNYYHKLIMPVQDMLTDIALTGPWCRVDRQKLHENQEQASLELTTLEFQMEVMVDPRIRDKHREKGLSFTRPSYVRDIIFGPASKGGLGIRPMKDFLTGVTKEPSLSEDHLKNFQHSNEIIAHYLRWKKLKKISTSYLNTIEAFIKPDGRIHPGTSLTRTVTGRTVMLNPPIQTYPSRGEFARYIREVFVADPGHVLVALDLAQSEMRIIGWLANDPGILSALKNGVDLHTKTASIMFGVPIANVTKKMRQDAKVFNFGLVYGMSAEGLKSFLEVDHGIVKTIEECREARETFFKGYSELPKYYESAKRFARRNMYVESPLGRRRRLPGIKNSEQKIRGEAERQCVNFPTQSFSSDLGLIAMYLLYKESMGAMWFIHDAVVMHTSLDDLRAKVRRMKEIVQVDSAGYIWDNFKLNVGYPIECDVKIGTTWANMVDSSKYFDEVEEHAEAVGLIL